MLRDIQSSHRRAPRALAGTAVAIVLLCAAEAASGAEVQSRLISLTPSGSPVDASNAVVVSSGPNCLPAHLGGPSDRSSSCLPGERAYALNLTSERASQLGKFDTYVSIANSGTDLTPERLLLGRDQLLADRGRVFLAGIKGSFWDDRLKLTTEMGWSERRGVRFQSADWQVNENEDDNGSARLIRLEAKLIDAPRLQWSVTSELSDVSDDFFLGDVAALRPMVALPGKRIAIASALKWGGTRFSAGFDRYQNRFGTFSAQRLGINLNGIAVRLRENSGSVTPASESPLLDGRSAGRSVTLEVEPASLFPALAGGKGVAAILLPEAVMVNWRAGWSETRFVDSTERYARNGLEASGTWETPLGETTISYWSDRRVGATASLGISRDRQLQLSHVIRRGDWSAGIDAFSSNYSSSRGAGFSDQGFSLGGMISYSRPNGPQMQIRLGRDRGQSSNDDQSFMSSQRFSSVTASLDLTQYVRRQFDRDDLRLTIDYRRRIESSDTVETFDYVIDRWSENERREGLLVSFGMKL